MELNHLSKTFVEIRKLPIQVTLAQVKVWINQHSNAAPETSDYSIPRRFFNKYNSN